MKRGLISIAMVMAGALAHGEITMNADVCVYGGTAGGCIAAITAAERGHDVVLFEPGNHLGGLMSGGLGHTDHGKRAVIGGKAREYFERNGARYDRDIEWYLEPHVAEELFRDWLVDAGVQVFFGNRVEDVQTDGTRITAMTFHGERTDTEVRAAMFVDASYEGDVLARAGVTYTVGREGRDVYGESLAGKIDYTLKHQFLVRVDPFDDDGDLLPLMQEDDGLAPGTGDEKIQAYNFRLCLTQDKDNQVPYHKPANYDPARYELLRRLLEVDPTLTFGQVCAPRAVPNGKTDVNNNGAVSTDHIGASWAYPEADYEERARIWQDHVDYVQGFFYFLAHDPSVPKALQEEANRWGPAKDEFVDNGNFPHQLYIREARRMVGAYVMTQKDLQTERTKSNSIGMGSYNSDSHNVQRFAAKSSPVLGEGSWIALNEGDMQVPVQPYSIAYGAITPKAEDCTNLLVVCCPSASHVAFSSIRMEPQYMIMGEAAGNAAHLALTSDTTVQDVPIDALQELLYETKSVLHFTDTVAPFYSIKAFPGIVVDTYGANVVGGWRSSTSVGNFVGHDYLTTVDDERGDSYVRFQPEIEKAGRYEVRVAYTPNPNRASNAHVYVHSAEGSDLHLVNQRKPLEEAPFQSLGVYSFEAGDHGYVEIRTENADGYVIADAVQWLSVD